MVEPIGLAASIIAVVQITDRIAKICKSYIDTVQDYPRDLRLIYVEVGSLKVVFEGLNFLDPDNPEDSATLKAVAGRDGPIIQCKETVEELEKMLPPAPSPPTHTRKRKKLQQGLANLAWPFKAERSRKLLHEIMQYKSTISVALQGQLLNDIRQMGRQINDISVVLEASEKQKLIDWLQISIPAGTNSWMLHSAATRLYESGTGDWVFQTPQWNDWINFQDRAIWLHGIPGAGKTILSSYVFEKIINICKGDPKQKCIYYYCYHGHNQDESDPFLQWLVSQSIRQQDQVPELTWKQFTGRGPPGREILLDTLTVMLSSLDRLFIGIDALDESKARENILELLGVLLTQNRFSKIQIFASSREYEDIRLRMSSISKPLSMSNTFVEADIRHYVAAKIRGNTRFQRWPQDLRNEVEHTLSINAKGMFRWTVCQLDILRRLNHQSKIREAIRSLPETLDETYERIFSYIVDQERDVVRHALHWVCFHDFLWKSVVPLSTKVLLDSYHIPEHGGPRHRPKDLILDVNILKDVCGCLVSFQPPKRMQDEETVTIAHYTVREFLESSRASSRDTAWTRIHTEHCYSAILMRTFGKAIDPANLPMRVHPFDSGEPFAIRTDSNLEEYCTYSSVYSFTTCENLVDFNMAIQLLDPSATFYDNMTKALSFDRTTLSGKIIFSSVCWEIETKQSKAAILVNLLNLHCFTLAKVLMSKVDTSGILRQELSGKLSNRGIFPLLKYDGGKCHRIQGNVLEILAQANGLDRLALDFISESSPSSISYTDLLPYFMICFFPIQTSIKHKIFEANRHAQLVDVLRRLLDLGADPDPKGFRTSPLQLASRARSIEGIRILLETGANPNSTGDPQGRSWDDDYVLGAGPDVQGHTPVDILHLFTPWRSREAVYEEEDIMAKEIESLLLSFGASPTQYPHMLNGRPVTASVE